MVQLEGDIQVVGRGIVIIALNWVDVQLQGVTQVEDCGVVTKVLEVLGDERSSDIKVRCCVVGRLAFAAEARGVTNVPHGVSAPHRNPGQSVTMCITKCLFCGACPRGGTNIPRVSLARSVAQKVTMVSQSVTMCITKRLFCGACPRGGTNIPRVSAAHSMAQRVAGVSQALQS
eukprot:4562468-Amphidinium_carterae.1